MSRPGPWLAAALALGLAGTTPMAARGEDAPIDDREIDPVQPDFLVVNLPTNLRLPRHAFAFALSHRFSRPLGEGDFSDLVGDFFGFDSGAKVGLGLRFGLFTATEIAVYRTNDRAIQFSAKRDLRQQKGSRGLSLGLMATVEGRDNFGEQYSPALALMVSRKLGQRAALYAVPVFVGNAAVDPNQGDDDALLLGLGGRVLLGHGMAVVAEWTPRLAGYEPLDPLDPRQSAGQSLSFGFEKRVGGHAFQLNFSNTFATTFTTLAQGATKTGWFIGFNLSRKFY
jgi:Membrane bound beta barrel domain (DUF5777)